MKLTIQGIRLFNIRRNYFDGIANEKFEIFFTSSTFEIHQKSEKADERKTLDTNSKIIRKQMEWPMTDVSI